MVVWLLGSGYRRRHRPDGDNFEMVLSEISLRMQSATGVLIISMVTLLGSS